MRHLYRYFTEMPSFCPQPVVEIHCSPLEPLSYSGSHLILYFYFKNLLKVIHKIKYGSDKNCFLNPHLPFSSFVSFLMMNVHFLSTQMMLLNHILSFFILANKNWFWETPLLFYFSILPIAEILSHFQVNLTFGSFFMAIFVSAISAFT